jgi:hypothetical protein
LIIQPANIQKLKTIPILQGSDVPKLRQAVIEKRGFRAPGVSGTGGVASRVVLGSGEAQDGFDQIRTNSACI